jgi:hypothetical protein
VAIIRDRDVQQAVWTGAVDAGMGVLSKGLGGSTGDYGAQVTDQEIIHVLWTCHEAFRRLGFSADDIFVSCAVIDPQTQRKTVGVVLMTQGRQFGIHTRPVADPEAFLKKWAEFAEGLRHGRPNDTELSGIWEKSEILARAGTLVGQLLLKGIRCRPGASLN